MGLGAPPKQQPGKGQSWDLSPGSGDRAPCRALRRVLQPQACLFTRPEAASLPASTSPVFWMQILLGVVSAQGLSSHPVLSGCFRRGGVWMGGLRAQPASAGPTAQISSFWSWHGHTLLAAPARCSTIASWLAMPKPARPGLPAGRPHLALAAEPPLGCPQPHKNRCHCRRARLV